MYRCNNLQEVKFKEAALDHFYGPFQLSKSMAALVGRGRSTVHLSQNTE